MFDLPESLVLCLRSEDQSSSRQDSCSENSANSPAHQSQQFSHYTYWTENHETQTDDLFHEKSSKTKQKAGHQTRVIGWRS